MYLRMALTEIIYTGRIAMERDQILRSFLTEHLHSALLLKMHLNKNVKGK